MKKSSLAVIFFVAPALLCFLYRVDINENFNPLEIIYAVLFGYVVAVLAYNGDGFVRHQLRKISDHHYRDRSKRHGLDKKNRFMLIPFKLKREGSDVSGS